jgi:lipid II:glycine glycyltransferase (peptidoglycan interpeptide bridge formation enzyme)
MSTAQAERALVARPFGPEESQAWDAFVAGAPNGHFLQSWAWGEVKARHRWRPVRLALEDDDRVVAAAQVLFRSQRGVSVAYVPRGPVVPPDRADLYAPLLEAIHAEARRHRSFFLKVEPNDPLESGLGRYLRKAGFVKSRVTYQPRASLLLSLEGGGDEVFARLRKKTRYNIRLAEKRGVSVRAARDIETDLREFHGLLAGTGERAGFGVRPLGYYRDVYEEFRARGQAELLLAEKDGQVVAAGLRVAYGGVGTAMYGASSDEHRRDNPNYLLLWKSIEWAIGRGCSEFDLWGIPERAVAEPDAEPPGGGDQLWGVYEFKRSFGGRPVRYVTGYDRPYIRPLYLLWTHLRAKSLG